VKKNKKKKKKKKKKTRTCCGVDPIIAACTTYVATTGPSDTFMSRNMPI